MILSDVSIRKALAEGKIVIDPLDESAIQPSSVDLRVDRYFRVFRNDTTPYIDPKQPQENLTELVEVKDENAFILHPGEFVLGSTLERVALPNDLVARLEGKSSLGRLGLLIHSSLPASEPVLVRFDERLEQLPIGDIVRKQLDAEVVGFDPETFEVAFHRITGWYEGPPDRIFQVQMRSGRSVRVTAGHNLFTLGRDGRIEKIRTATLRCGMKIAVPRAIPETFVPDPCVGAAGPPPPDDVVIDVLSLLPEHSHARVVVEGPSVRAAWTSDRLGIEALLREAGYRSVDHYRAHDRLPLVVAQQCAEVVGCCSRDDRLGVRGGKGTIPAEITLNEELAWLLGLYVAAGSHRRNQVTLSNTDQDILDRTVAVLVELGVSCSRASGSVTACSAIFEMMIDGFAIGDSAVLKRIPRGLLGLPRPLLEAFLEGMVDGDGSRDESRTSVWTCSPGLVSDLLLLGARLQRRVRSCYRKGARRGPYQVDFSEREHIDAGLLWDEVVEVVDTGEVESIYDIEVRPGGRAIENFLAGSGGVFVSNTAGFVDAGWDGYLTLELSNVANLPIAIYPGMKIGQISFLQMTTEAENPYGGGATGSKYQGQRGPTPSRYYMNFRP